MSSASAVTEAASARTVRCGRRPAAAAAFVRRAGRAACSSSGCDELAHHPLAPRDLGLEQPDACARSRSASSKRWSSAACASRRRASSGSARRERPLGAVGPQASSSTCAAAMRPASAADAHLLDLGRQLGQLRAHARRARARAPPRRAARPSSAVELRRERAGLRPAPRRAARARALGRARSSLRRRGARRRQLDDGVGSRLVPRWLARATKRLGRAVRVGELRVDAHRGRLVLVADLGEGHAVEGQLRDHAHVRELAARPGRTARSSRASRPRRVRRVAVRARRRARRPRRPTMRRTRAASPPDRRSARGRRRGRGRTARSARRSRSSSGVTSTTVSAPRAPRGARPAPCRDRAKTTTRRPAASGSAYTARAWCGWTRGSMACGTPF